MASVLNLCVKRRKSDIRIMAVNGKRMNRYDLGLGVNSLRTYGRQVSIA